MKKFFSVFALALVLAFSTIAAFANTNVTAPYEEATVEVFAGFINWNGEAFELGMQDDYVVMFLTFGDLSETYASEYFIESEVSLHFFQLDTPYDVTVIESLVSFVRWNGEAWELAVMVGNSHTLWIFDGLELAYENEYPVELKALYSVMDEWSVYQFAPVVIEDLEDDQPTALPFVVPTPQPAPAPVVPAAPQPTPAPAAEVVPAPTVSAYHYVWLSATGTRWHSINNCGRMNPANARRVRLDYARALTGFGPCATCNPPR
jgi:hypothetical protein